MSVFAWNLSPDRTQDMTYLSLHNSKSSLLIGELISADIVKERKMISLKDIRLLFS